MEQWEHYSEARNKGTSGATESFIEIDLVEEKKDELHLHPDYRNIRVKNPITGRYDYIRAVTDDNIIITNFCGQCNLTSIEYARKNFKRIDWKK